MTAISTDNARTQTLPPYSQLARRAAGVSLVLAGLLNGGTQYLTHLAAGDLDTDEYIRWGLEHQGLYRLEQFGLMVSSLFLLLGFLGLAQVTRWGSPRLTLAGTVLTVWGMWGFGNILSAGYAAQVVAADLLGVDTATRLVEDGYLEDWGIMAGGLLPHLIGSFFGILLLVAASLRSRAVPRVPAALLAVFLVWDFLLPAVGPLEAHLVLLVALVWLGVAMLKMPHERWRGRDTLS